MDNYDKFTAVVNPILYFYFINHTELFIDNYGTVDIPARISTVFYVLMHLNWRIA